MKRIEQMYAFVLVDETGDEGIPAITVNGLAMPLVGADMGRIDELRTLARKLAALIDTPMTLVRFEVRTELEVIEP